ncbi:MAG: DUF1080 domain-containing protein [Planctomycetaceae bacterium]
MSQTAPSPNNENSESNDGFVSLFNGKDLEGWETHPSQPGDWTVDNMGVLVGKWKGASYLYTKESYSDFHLRVEAKVSRDGNSGIYYWSSYDPARLGPEAQIYVGPSNKSWRLYTGNTKRILTKADEWFTLEIIVRDHHVQMKVNGELTHYTQAPENKSRNGRIALQVTSEETVIQFKKIELTDLSVDTKVSDQAVSVATTQEASNRTAANDGFIPLFNGKNLDGWEQHPTQPADWKVTSSGILEGTGNNTSHLYSIERFTDFHLRAEVRINGDGNSGIIGRASFGPQFPENRPRWPLGYEAQIYEGSGPRTGSLYAAEHGAVVVVDKSKATADDWIDLELSVRGIHVVIKVNGIQTAEYYDPNNQFRSGRIALELNDKGTKVEFRKIEIKDFTGRYNQKVQEDNTADFPAGSIWKGNRTYRLGGYAGSTVTYSLYVVERTGNTFTGNVYDNGPRKNHALVAGTINGNTISWTERPVAKPDAELQMTGVIENGVIDLKFTGRYGNGVRTEGDGQLRRDYR